MDKLVVKICSTLCLFCIISMPGINVAAEDMVSREYKIKAAYIYNLIKFIRWPQSDLTTTLPSVAPTASTSICVYGSNPFSQYLDKLTTRKAKGRAIDVSYIEKNETLPRCDIVFISESSNLSPEQLNDLFKLPLLTVGENRGFLEQGGIISLVVDQNNVQLQINLTQAKKNGFEISGNLLEIAKQIQ